MGWEEEGGGDRRRGWDRNSRGGGKWDGINNGWDGNGNRRGKRWGNGGGPVEVAVFLGRGGGRGRGQHYTPIFIIYFF